MGGALPGPGCYLRCMRRRQLILLLTGAIAASGCLVFGAGRGHAIGHPCEGRGTRIVIVARAHRACLCTDGALGEVYRVSLGRGGLDKNVESDNRTPLGEYALGEPYASKLFHVFVPVGYPTASQHQAGRTGGSVGLHGPPRWSRRLGRVNGWADWTRGCIGFESDRAIDEVAAWIRAHPGAPVEIDRDPQ
jgi:hypothetical protein